MKVKIICVQAYKPTHKVGRLGDSDRSTMQGFIQGFGGKLLNLAMQQSYSILD